MNLSVNSRRRIRRSRRGMTLVEVMIVIAIIVTLMSVLAYGVMSVWESSKVETTRLQMGRIQERILIHTVKAKKPPSTGDGLSTVYGDEPVPVDAWGNEFVYVSPGPDGKDYDLISYGRDGVQGGTGNNTDLSLADLQ